MAKKEHGDIVPKKGVSKKTKHSGPEEGGEEACRCREVAEKTPKELLKLAIDDLSFWKKIKKG